jgi:transcription antitermination factor NusG
MGVENKLWYALYTKPRCEKKVHEYLQAKGIESYCPLQKTKKRWSDRYKIIEEPLFKSYVFVKITEKEKVEVRLTTGVVNFVYWLGKPAEIAEEDINTIKKFLKEYTNVSVKPIFLMQNQRVKITAGVLMDSVAIVKKVLKNKVIVELQIIGFMLTAEVRKQEVMLLEN